MVADRADAAAVHHDDAVGILHGSDALRNDDLGGLGNELTEPLADQGVGLGVHRAGGVVQDQHFGLFQQRAGNAQALLLAAGYVGAALLDPGVVLVGELLDEFVGLRQFAGLHHLSVGGVRVAPAQVVFDRAGEQHVFLQHDGDIVAQRFQVVPAHVHAAYLDAAFGHVVQAGDQLHQRGLGGTRAAQNADQLAGLDVQVHICQCHALGALGIFEADIIKVNGAVLHFGDGVFGAGQAAFLRQNLHDTLGRFHRHGDHHKDHREHHQTHEDLEAVGEDGGHLADGDFGAAAGDDGVGTEGEHKNHTRVDAELHHGAVQGHDALGFGEVLADVFRSGGKLLLLIVLPHVALDHAHGLHVFLDRVVQGIVLAEHAAENRHCGADHQHQADAQQGDGHQEDHGQTAAHNKAHDE